LQALLSITSINRPWRFSWIKMIGPSTRTVIGSKLQTFVYVLERTREWMRGWEQVAYTMRCPHE
jgi:hypothetical protein